MSRTTLLADAAIIKNETTANANTATRIGEMFEDIINEAVPYKVYKALLTQTSTNAPVATVLQNTLGGTPVWSYDSVGYYKLTLSGAFAGNVIIRFGNEGSTDGYIVCFSNNFTDNEINVFTSLLSNIGGGDDEILFKTSITIEVYE